MSKKKTLLTLVILLLIGFYLRSGVGLHWDDEQHLHPDERFLTMVTNDIRLPKSLRQYMDSKTSPLSPYNTNFGFFVYGTFPIFLTKYAAHFTGLDEYGKIPDVGRILSSLFDLGCIILIFLIGSRLYTPAIGLLSAALLTFTVLNIQLSHFYGVETQSAFFILLTFYLLIHLYKDNNFNLNSISFNKRYIISIFSGITLGIGLASKISAVYFLPIMGIIVFLPVFQSINPLTILKKFLKADTWKELLLNSVFFTLTLFTAALSFRFFQPYAFSGDTIFDFRLAEKFISNMNEIRGAMKGADMPPSIQWVNRPVVLFSLYNLAVWGMGFMLGLSVCLGVFFMLYEIFKRNKLIHIYILSWSLFWFFNQSTQFVKAGRYLSIIYPFLALIAAYFLISASEYLKTKYKSKIIISLPWALVLGFTFLWALAFSSIYSKPHTRVAASHWIYENIPCGSKLGNEHWDDGLPLRVDGKDGFGGCYKGLEFNHYWPDDQKKLQDTLSKINEADYIILSSNRLYMSIPRLPKRFPFTIEYYKMLFSGDLGFDLVKTFRSYPEIFGIQFNSDFAEEPFTVYDHPKVYIFKKNPAKFDMNQVRARLSSFPDGVMEPLVSGL